MADKTDALKAAITQIEKQYGKGSIMRLGQTEALNVEAISTGSIALAFASSRRRRASSSAICFRS